MLFGVAQADPAGAGLAGDDVIADMLPAVGLRGGVAVLALDFEGDFVGGGLGFGGYCRPGGEAEGHLTSQVIWGIIVLLMLKRARTRNRTERAQPAGITHPSAGLP